MATGVATRAERAQLLIDRRLRILRTAVLTINKAGEWREMSGRLVRPDTAACAEPFMNEV